MTKLVRFQSADGSAPLVEIDEEVFGTARNDERVLEVNQDLYEVLANVQPTIMRILEAFSALKALPNEDKVQVGFGLKLSAEGGAVLASTPGEGQFHFSQCRCPDR